MEMEARKVEVKLDDLSLIEISRTKQGDLYLQLYQPGLAKDGHGMLLRAASFLSEQQEEELQALLTGGPQNLSSSSK